MLFYVDREVGVVPPLDIPGVGLRAIGMRPVAAVSHPSYNWQASKTTLKERFLFLFNNELQADVHFVVGRGVSSQRIPAHKVRICFKIFLSSKHLSRAKRQPKFCQIPSFYEVCLKSIGTVCFAQTTLATVIKALFFKMAQCLVVVKM